MKRVVVAPVDPTVEAASRLDLERVLTFDPEAGCGELGMDFPAVGRDPRPREQWFASCHYSPRTMSHAPRGEAKRSRPVAPMSANVALSPRAPSLPFARGQHRPNARVCSSKGPTDRSVIAGDMSTSSCEALRPLGSLSSSARGCVGSP